MGQKDGGNGWLDGWGKEMFSACCTSMCRWDGRRRFASRSFNASNRVVFVKIALVVLVVVVVGERLCRHGSGRWL